MAPVPFPGQSLPREGFLAPKELSEEKLEKIERVLRKRPVRPARGRALQVSIYARHGLCRDPRFDLNREDRARIPSGMACRLSYPDRPHYRSFAREHVVYGCILCPWAMQDELSSDVSK